jgi:hypothetical protein
MYNRIYKTLFEGSMVGAGALTFAVWSYVLGKMKPSRKDAQFYVEINPVLLAAILGEGQGEVEAVILKMCGPDESSRTKDEKGARLIREGQFLYRVVNGAKYNDLRSHDQRLAYQRVKQAEYRRTKKQRLVAAQSSEREKRFVEADGNGEIARADEIAAEGLPPAA